MLNRVGYFKAIVVFCSVAFRSTGLVPQVQVCAPTALELGGGASSDDMKQAWAQWFAKPNQTQFANRESQSISQSINKSVRLGSCYVNWESRVDLFSKKSVVVDFEDRFFSKFDKSWV